MKCRFLSQQKWTLFFLFLISSILITTEGCYNEGRGFALPEGNVDDGKAIFEELKCNICHSVSDISFIGETVEENIKLGGETTRIKTYGELVSSIINPSHRIETTLGLKPSGESKMINYNDVMTIQQMVDLVTFLKEEYKLVAPEGTYYPHYY